MNVLVTGAGGFIGGHLVKRLVEEGNDVTAVDIKPLTEWWQVHGDALNFVKDISTIEDAAFVCSGRMRKGKPTEPIEEVYHLAADMGGIGFIERNKLECMLSVKGTISMLEASVHCGVDRFFYASSACVYPLYHQNRPDVAGLREDMAYPADPEDGYGWEKLFCERLCRHFEEETPLKTRVARYHNVFGPHGTWIGGREKAPAAICRKVAYAKAVLGRTILLWGDGDQTRSFIYVDDAVEGTIKLMRSDCDWPTNIGSEHMVTISELAQMVMKIAGVELNMVWDPGQPKGVRGRNADLTLARERLHWEPKVSLVNGLIMTYPWVEQQVLNNAASDDRTE
jgi:GDP-D-mannose 3', 5'-epimerase